MLEWLQMIFIGHVHKWEVQEAHGFLVQKCSVCGKSKVIRPLSTECQHNWETIREGSLVDGNNPKGVPTGHYYYQKCTRCGEMRQVKF